MTSEFNCDVFLNHDPADKPRVRRRTGRRRTTSPDFVLRTSDLALRNAGRHFTSLLPAESL